MGAMLENLETPVVIVGVKSAGVQNGMTAAWITQVSYEPCLVAVAIAPLRYTHSLIKASQAFALSILKRGQEDIARDLGHRSGAAGPKLDKLPLISRVTGSPILADAGAYIDCRLLEARKTGDHTLIIGEVVDQGVLAGGPYLPFTMSLYS